MSAEHQFMSWEAGAEGIAAKPSPASLALSFNDVRVLGSLIEKEVTTPAYYPLSLNALVNACNQKNNRRPTTCLGPEEVNESIVRLRASRLVTAVTGGGNQVVKFKQNITRLYALDQAEAAALCVLMLRGPLTLGEIRQTASPMHEFSSLSEVESTLERLSAMPSGALLQALPRITGQKEIRYGQLLTPPADDLPAGEQDLPLAIRPPQRPEAPEAVFAERMAELENKVDSLSGSLTRLEQKFNSLLARLGE